MLHLKVGLKPTNNIPLTQDYTNYLRSLCCNCIGKTKNAPCQFILSDTSAQNNLQENNDLVAFSLFKNENSNLKSNTSEFNTNVFWNVECGSYDKIEKLIQELYRLKNIRIENSEFEICSIELH